MTRSLDQLLPPQGRAAVMGILNITPDSFSDGGALYEDGRYRPDSLLARAAAMAEAGVDIFDVGGESTRPGARPVTTEEELARVLPAIRLLKAHFDVPVSVDTSSPVVMAAAVEEGVAMINDVRALQRPGAVNTVRDSGLPVCLMHMPAEPGVMQHNPHYADVKSDVWRFLSSRIEECVAAGMDRRNIAIDPGFGFGKTLDHNLTLFRALADLAAEGYPLLVGVSRKRMVGELLDREPGQRLIGSVALALQAVQRGARIVRVHDVPETIDALKTYYALEGLSI